MLPRFGLRLASLPTRRLARRAYTPAAAAATTAAADATAPSDLVDRIAALSLLETAALVAALKTRLNIQDVVVAAPAVAPAASAATDAASAASDAAAAAAKERTHFSVKLDAFDAAAKAKVIRQVKAIVPGINLVDAKKLVESAPKVLKENVPKDEAEKLKDTLVALGASVSLE